MVEMRKQWGVHIKKNNKQQKKDIWHACIAQFTNKMQCTENGKKELKKRKNHFQAD